MKKGTVVRGRLKESSYPFGFGGEPAVVMPMIIRLSKVALVAGIGIFLLLVVFNNLTDYGSNLLFVENVLNMSTTFEGNNAMWRAIDAPWIHHLFYWTIILWEAAAMILIFAGGWGLWKARAGPAAGFNRAKSLAVGGLTLSLLQWHLAFLTVGGEWFLMWQSQIWNGQDAAHRMFAVIGIVLLVLLNKDEELVEHG